MNITLWEQSPDGSWKTTFLRAEDQITVHAKEEGTVFTYERNGRGLAVIVDDVLQAYYELSVAVHCPLLQTLCDSLDHSLERVGLRVELEESTEHTTFRSREFGTAVFVVLAR